MPITINFADGWSGGGSLQNTDTVESQVAAYGGPILPSIGYSYGHGTGDGQVDKWHLGKRTLNPTTYDDINLTSDLKALGVTQAFTKLKRVLVAIIDPDGVKKLRVGPQGRTNANPLWFQAATANFWEETFNAVVKDRPIGGWPVTAAATDVLSVYNPGADPIDYALLVLGN